jgi:hypothetical protein
MDLVKYREIQGVPGRYFDCPRNMGMLSTGACAKAYQDAMSPDYLREGRRITCRGCPVGAQHAGVAAGPAISRFLGSTMCSRHQGDGGRLIRGAICVSCYNREREWKIGKNAKGAKPVHARPIGAVALALVDRGQAKVVHAGSVTGLLEAVIQILRTAREPVSFGWGRSRPKFKGQDV